MLDQTYLSCPIENPFNGIERNSTWFRYNLMKFLTRIRSMELKASSTSTLIHVNSASLGIRSMELKASYGLRAPQKCSTSTNPFNGIERIPDRHPKSNNNMTRNPFNGIESLNLATAFSSSPFSLNPFNGIESRRHFYFTVAGMSRESVQWN